MLHPTILPTFGGLAGVNFNSSLKTQHQFCLV